MNHHLPLLLATCMLPGDTGLETVYVAETSYRVTRETSLELETVDFSIERDGEPMQGGFGGGGRGSGSQKTVTYVDRVLEVEDGAPVSVRRVFETAAGSVLAFEQEVDLDSDFDGAALLISADGDDVSIDIEDGDVDEDALEGQRPTLPLDTLLPEDDVAAGDVWDVDGDDFLHALGLDVAQHLFLPPEFDFGDWEGGGGRRGGSGRSFGDSESYLRDAEWDVQLTLESGVEAVEGVECQVIDIGGSGSGTREFEGMGGGRRGGRSPVSVMTVRGPFDTEFELEVEGKLFFATELGRPVKLDVTVYFSIESDHEFERRESTMRMRRVQEGAFEHTLTIEAIEDES